MSPRGVRDRRVLAWSGTDATLPGSWTGSGAALGDYSLTDCSASVPRLVSDALSEPTTISRRELSFGVPAGGW